MDGAGVYEISVKTGDRRGSGTDANVFIQVYGEKGNSRKMLLDNNSNNFERGQTDNFSLQCGDLGSLQKIRIGHDNSGFGPGWFLEKVIIKNQKTNSTYFFFAGRWLAKDEGDRAIEVELPASTEDGGLVVPLVTYTVRCYTGDRRGAGTDANVYIILYGENGDSGERQLENELNNFERGKMDKFGFQCLDLGDLKKIKFVMMEPVLDLVGFLIR